MEEEFMAAVKHAKCLHVIMTQLGFPCMAVHHYKDYYGAPILPTSGIQLNLATGTITYNMKKELSMAWTAEPMK